jgi:hypothetical protein
MEVKLEFKQNSATPVPDKEIKYKDSGNIFMQLTVIRA